MIALFDPAHTLSYGYWICPVCHREFYGGGKAMHEPGCTETGYGNCIYAFGPNEGGHFAPAELREEIRKILRDAS